MVIPAEPEKPENVRIFTDFPWQRQETPKFEDRQQQIKDLLKLLLRIFHGDTRRT